MSDLPSNYYTAYPLCTVGMFVGVNEAPRRKQRGILMDYHFILVASDWEFNP